MPEDKKKEELTVDIDSSGPDTEVEIKEEKTEGGTRYHFFSTDNVITFRLLNRF